MTQIRLNNEMRDRIRSKLIAHRFAKEEAEIDAEENSVALAMYRVMYTEEQRTKMNELPCGWLPEECCFELNAGGQRISARIRTGSVRIPYQDERHYSTPRKNVDTANPAAVQFFEWHNKKEAFKARRNTTAHQVSALLRNARTVKQLVDTWPEVAPFVPKDDAPMTCELTVPIKDLNAMLGLP